MLEKDKTGWENHWIDFLGGTRFTALLFGMIVTTHVVLIWHLVIWGQIMMKATNAWASAGAVGTLVLPMFNWGFAVTVISETLACITTYIIGKTIQHHKEIDKNGIVTKPN